LFQLLIHQQLLCYNLLKITNIKVTIKLLSYFKASIEINFLEVMGETCK